MRFAKTIQPAIVGYEGCAANHLARILGLILDHAVGDAAAQLWIDIGPHQPLVHDGIDVGALATPLDLLDHGLLLDGLQIRGDLQTQRGQGVRLQATAPQYAGIKVKGTNDRFLERYDATQRGVARLLPQLVEGIVRPGECKELHARVLPRVRQASDDAAAPYSRHNGYIVDAPNFKC